MRTITATVLLFLIKLSSQENYCEPRASGYIGQSATISCNLDTTGSRSIFWYYENYDNDPLIRLEGGEKRGQGYDRNEYDLLQNGSLVITNVTSSNEGSYKVILGAHDPVEFRTTIVFSVIETINDLLSSPENGHLRRTITDAEFECEDGFQLVGKPRLECSWNDDVSNCSWSESRPACVSNTVTSSSTSTDLKTTKTSGTQEEHCPAYQSGYLGENALIVCHFKPNFIEVIWFDDIYVSQPLIRRKGSDVSGPGNDKYTITNNGSLLIPRVSDENNKNYTVILVDANNKNSSHPVSFVAEASCNVTSPPENGYFNNIRKSVTLAKVSCNEGYHLNVSNYSVCKDGPEIANDRLFGSSPTCIPDHDTTTRSTLHPYTMSMTRPTETCDQNDCSVHELCSGMMIAIIIESVLLLLLLLVFIVVAVYVKRVKQVKYSRQNNTRSSQHKATEEVQNLNPEQGETSQ